MTEAEQIERATKRLLGIRRFRPKTRPQQEETMYEINSDGRLTITYRSSVSTVKTDGDPYSKAEIEKYLQNDDWIEI